MTNVELVEYMRERELSLREVFNKGREMTEGDNLMMALDDAHYKMRLEAAKYQDAKAQSKADSDTINVKLTSEVKVKR